MTSRTIHTGPPLAGKTHALLDAYAQSDRYRTIYLSFYRANHQQIASVCQARGMTEPAAAETVHSFASSLLRRHAALAGLPPRPAVASAAARRALLANAWAHTNDALYKEFGQRPGALGQLARVTDRISANRKNFTVAKGEFGPHELARTYEAYIRTCTAQEVLTFQETVLRCIDLLDHEAVLADVKLRYSHLLLDDLHHARPDELLLAERLIEIIDCATGSAWLPETSCDPAVRHARRSVARWGQLAPLNGDGSKANPNIRTLLSRLTAVSGTNSARDDTRPAVTFIDALSAQDEISAVAAHAVKLLRDDDGLRPGDIAVIACDPRLLGPARRELAACGLSSPAPALPAHTPLIRTALLAIAWVHGRRDSTTEKGLLSLPFTAVDPLEVARLERYAEQHSIPLFESAALADVSEHTAGAIQSVATALGDLPDGDPASATAASAVLALEAIHWAWLAEEYPGATMDEWTRAYNAWLRDLKELEATIDTRGQGALDHLPVIANLARPALVRSNSQQAVQLLSALEASAHRARVAFVIGLSESAFPARRTQLQLIAEHDLPALFTDGRDCVPLAPADEEIWIEREMRRLATVLSRATERLFASVSRHDTGGSSQLPSPFFERLLGSDGSLDRDGNVVLAAGGNWEHAELDTALQHRVHHLPLADIPAPADPPAATASVLSDHVFSASQLRTYLACPLQFFYSKVLRIRPDPVAAFERGSLMHEILCVTMGDGSLKNVDLRDRPHPQWMAGPEALLERARAALKGAEHGEALLLPGGDTYQPSKLWGGGFGPELQRRAVWRWAGGILERWSEFVFEGLSAPLERRPILLETKFELQLGTHTVVGVIDRIDLVPGPEGPTYELIDYKTGSSAAISVKQHVARFWPGDGKEAEDFQLPLYALAMMDGLQGLQTAPSRLSFFNLEKMMRGKRGEFGAAAYRSIDLVRGGGAELSGKGKSRAQARIGIDLITGAVAENISATLENMASAPYNPKPDYRTCRFCAYQAACDRGRAMAT